MLAFVLGNGLRILDGHLKPPGVKQPFTALDTAYHGLAVNLPTRVKFTGAISADGECQNVVRGSLALYGVDQVDQAKNLLTLISSTENFEKALKAIVREHFADPTWEPHGD